METANGDNSHDIELLRLKDVLERTGLPRSTAADWIAAFAAYIPEVLQGRTRYFKQETIEILMEIRDWREYGYDKTQIAEMLAEKYPVNVDELEKKAEQHRNNDTARQRDAAAGRDAVYTAMQAVGEMAQRMDVMQQEVTEQAERIQQQEEINEQLRAQIAEQNEAQAQQAAAAEKVAQEQAEIRAEQTEAMRAEIKRAKEEAKEQAKAEAKAEIQAENEAAAEKAAEEERNKGFFARLFGK